jgi:hypothetical protein
MDIDSPHKTTRNASVDLESDNSLNRKRARASKTTEIHKIKKQTEPKILNFICPTFDITTSSEGLEFIDNSVICNSGSRKKHMFAFGDTKLEDSSFFSMRIKEADGWIAVGVCNRDMVICNEFMFAPRIKHFCYMISTNGYAWNSSNSCENNIRLKDFCIKPDTEIKIAYCSGKVKITVGMVTYTLNKVEGELYPCCILLRKGDSVTFTK